MIPRFTEKLPDDPGELGLAGSEDDEMEDDESEDYEDGDDGDDEEEEEVLALFLADCLAKAGGCRAAISDGVDKIRKEQQREINSVGSRMPFVAKVPLGQNQEEVIGPDEEQRQSKRKREGRRDGTSHHVTRTLKDGTIVRGRQGATFAGFIPYSRTPKQAPILGLLRDRQKPLTPESSPKTTSTMPLDDSALATSTGDIRIQRVNSTSTSTKRDFSNGSSGSSLYQRPPLPKRRKSNPE